jgi:hypothetical protein
MPSCSFCGFSGKLTAEHVFGNWLSRIGLDLAPVSHGAGPLNRIGQELGVRPPFRQTVRVCGGRNNGWMSHLETVTRRVLTSFILGEAGQVETDDAGAVAACVQKTALTAMLVSFDAQRSAGYGLPPSEYRGLWTGRAAMQPLPASQFWIGRYVGRTEPDGAHCKAADTTETISELYESLPGEEVVIEDQHGIFPCKRLPGPSTRDGNRNKRSSRPWSSVGVAGRDAAFPQFGSTVVWSTPRCWPTRASRDQPRL